MSDESQAPSRTTVTRFDLTPDCVLKLPVGSKLLTVKWHDSGARLWVANDPELPKVARRVKIITTGLDVYGDNWEYAGTIFVGRLGVSHVFVEIV